MPRYAAVQMYPTLLDPDVNLKKVEAWIDQAAGCQHGLAPSGAPMGDELGREERPHALSHLVTRGVQMFAGLVGHLMTEMLVRAFGL